MLLIAVFLTAVAVIFAIHIFVLRKAVKEHQALLAMSSLPAAPGMDEAAA